MTAYYNEIDPFAADWLRNLISAGLIAPGEVDTRSIKDVSAADVRGFTQCHFFAGIGGWSIALRIASWQDETPVWTGSCPCQPFSAAGNRKGTADERHLWPEFRRLIAECRPAITFGEQVASKDGRNWLTRVRSDLEEMGYGVGAADLCAAGAGEEGQGWFVHLGGVVVRERTRLGAPHIRQRLFWGARAVGDAEGVERRLPTGSERERDFELVGASEARIVAEPDQGGCGKSERNVFERQGKSDAFGSSQTCIVGDADGAQRNARSKERQERGETGIALPSAGSEVRWSDFAIIPCLDNKSRRIEPDSFPLVDGIPRDMGRGRSKLERVAIRAARANRTGRLKGYGNAIVPGLAAEFVAAFMESVE